MIKRRLLKRFVTARTLLPLRYDRAVSRAANLATRYLSGRRKLLAIVCLTVLGGGLVGLGSSGVGWALLLIPGGTITFSRVLAYYQRYQQVRRIASKTESVSGLPSWQVTMSRIGLEDSVLRDIASKATSGQEVLLGEFDQNNRVASLVGPIAMLGDAVADPKEFDHRRRNRVQLVIFRGVVCVKKTYVSKECFMNEVLALEALRAISGVPKLVYVDSKRHVLYQSFLVGKNLGTLAAANGMPVSVQHQLSVTYPGPGMWFDRTAISPERKQALAVLRAVAGTKVVDMLQDLLNRIHTAGVTISDVKFGNVILDNGRPQLCDFDIVRVFRKNCRQFVVERDRNRDMFNYVFGGSMMTHWQFRAEVERLAHAKEDLLYAPVYYGKGYEFGNVDSIEFGSGKWQFMKRHLPDVRGKRILDLGSNNGVIPLEMLRAGAAEVTGYEANPTFAALARLNHERFEFVDNRKYSFRLVEESMDGILRDAQLPAFDIATAFCSLYYLPVDDMKRVVSFLSERVQTFIVQCNENPNEHTSDLLVRCSAPFIRHLLLENGFEEQRAVEFSYYDRPLIIAHSSRYRPPPSPKTLRDDAMAINSVELGDFTSTEKDSLEA